MVPLHHDPLDVAYRDLLSKAVAAYAAPSPRFPTITGWVYRDLQILEQAGTRWILAKGLRIGPDHGPLTSVLYAVPAPDNVDINDASGLQRLLEAAHGPGAWIVERTEQGESRTNLAHEQGLALFSALAKYRMPPQREKFADADLSVALASELPRALFDRDPLLRVA